MVYTLFIRERERERGREREREREREIDREKERLSIYNISLSSSLQTQRGMLLEGGIIYLCYFMDGLGVNIYIHVTFDWNKGVGSGKNILKTDKCCITLSRRLVIKYVNSWHMGVSGNNFKNFAGIVLSGLETIYILKIKYVMDFSILFLFCHIEQMGNYELGVSGNNNYFRKLCV